MIWVDELAVGFVLLVGLVAVVLLSVNRRARVREVPVRSKLPVLLAAAGALGIAMASWIAFRNLPSFDVPGPDLPTPAEAPRPRCRVLTPSVDTGDARPSTGPPDQAQVEVDGTADRVFAVDSEGTSHALPGLLMPGAYWVEGHFGGWASRSELQAVAGQRHRVRCHR
jgi:hypothetical protein